MTARVLHLDERVAEMGVPVLNGDAEELAWKKDHFQQVVGALKAAGVPIAGIDVWGPSEDGELEFANVFPPVWSPKRGESSVDYLDRAAAEAIRAALGVQFTDGSEPLFTFIPSVKRLGSIVVVNVAEAEIHR